MTTARLPRRHRPTIALAAALAAVALAACSSSGAAGPAHQVPAVPAAVGPNTPFTSLATVDPAPAPAPSAAEAVQRYASAEAAGDWAASYALLGDEDRTRVGSFAAWVDEADDRLPLLSLADVTMDGTTVVTTAVLDARLDEARFVPGRARIEWRPVAVDAGWLVSPTATRVDAQLPPQESATSVVDAWLAGRRRGETTGQYAGNLLGQPTLVERLPADDLRAGAPGPLAAAPDPQVAVHAFGPDASRFVRAVPVDGSVRLVVLVAPYGDAWEVVGVQAPR